MYLHIISISAGEAMGMAGVVGNSGIGMILCWGWGWGVKWNCVRDCTGLYVGCYLRSGTECAGESHRPLAPMVLLRIAYTV